MALKRTATDNIDGECVEGFVMFRPTQETKRDSEGRESNIKKASVRPIERDNLTGAFVVAKDARGLAALKDFLWEDAAATANTAPKASFGGC